MGGLGRGQFFDLLLQQKQLFFGRQGKGIDLLVPLFGLGVEEGGLVDEGFEFSEVVDDGFPVLFNLVHDEYNA